jgi:hypothetical protein
MNIDSSICSFSLLHKFDDLIEAALNILPYMIFKMER